MEAFFFGDTGIKFVRHHLLLGTYWEMSRFNVRKLSFGVFQLTMNMNNVSKFKKLTRQPAGCTNIAKSPDDKKKLYGKGSLMSAHRLYLNRACAECKKDIKETLCENRECKRCQYSPPWFDKLRTYKATLAVNLSEKNNQASSWMRKDNVKNVELIGKPWVLTPHLEKLFDPMHIKSLLEGGAVGHMEKYNDQIKQALADMLDVWAACIRNTGQEIEVEYTNRRYGFVDRDGGGSRYLTDIRIDYSKITQEDKESNGYLETVTNVKDLLAMMEADSERPNDNYNHDADVVDEIVEGEVGGG